jgi:hypothetical protein
LAVELSRKDRSFPWKDTEQLLREVRAHYALLSTTERFHQVVNAGDHAFHCDPRTLAFLAQMCDVTGG